MRAERRHLRGDLQRAGNVFRDSSLMEIFSRRPMEFSTHLHRRWEEENMLRL